MRFCEPSVKSGDYAEIRMNHKAGIGMAAKAPKAAKPPPKLTTDYADHTDRKQTPQSSIVSVPIRDIRGQKLLVSAKTRTGSSFDSFCVLCVLLWLNRSLRQKRRLHPPSLRSYRRAGRLRRRAPKPGGDSRRPGQRASLPAIPSQRRLGVLECGGAAKRSHRFGFLRRNRRSQRSVRTN